MTTHASTHNIDNFLSQPLTVGDPDVAGPLAVFPLFGPDPRQTYAPFAEGRSRGVRITELENQASVNDLVVANPADVPVLLYEGEEVLGAQQNRTFDVTVLVAAGSKVQVPVTCVEVGRWDHSRHAEDLSPAPQAAYPDLRRAKNRRTRERVMADLDARADQGEVWREVAAKSARHQANAPTGAMHDVFESRRGRLHELADAIHWHDGQCGALVALGGNFAVLDYVSRPAAFTVLHGPLVQGYALDALEVQDTPAPSLDEARGFVALVTGTRASEQDGIGLGSDLRFAEDGVAGSGLVAEAELIQLTAFPDDGNAAATGPRAPVSHIRRPSRRRR